MCICFNKYLKQIQHHFTQQFIYALCVALDVLKQKNLIHCHSGKLPKFRGSTTIYYSLLKEKKIFCSTLILSKNIDQGKILLIRKYSRPKNILTIDKKYDDFIRSKNLLYVLKNFEKLKPMNQKANDIIPYYVMHPVLRSIAFKK